MGHFDLYDNIDKLEFPMGGSVDLNPDKSLTLHFNNQNFAIIQIPCNMHHKDRAIFKLTSKVRKGNTCKFMCYSHQTKSNTILGTDAIDIDRTPLRLILPLCLPLPDDTIIFKIQSKGNKITEVTINEFIIEDAIPPQRIKPKQMITLFRSNNLKEKEIKNKLKIVKKQEPEQEKLKLVKEKNKKSQSREGRKINTNVKLAGLGLDKTLDRLKRQKFIHNKN